jgi:hypothetical protein
METDQARQEEALQEENSWLKQLVADLSLDKTMLQDVLRKSSEALGRRPMVDLREPVSRERAAGLPGSSDGARHVSLSESSGTMDGVADLKLLRDRS